MKDIFILFSLLIKLHVLLNESLHVFVHTLLPVNYQRYLAGILRRLRDMDKHGVKIRRHQKFQEHLQ